MTGALAGRTGDIRPVCRVCSSIEIGFCWLLSLACRASLKSGDVARLSPQWVWKPCLLKAQLWNFSCLPHGLRLGHRALCLAGHRSMSLETGILGTSVHLQQLGHPAGQRGHECGNCGFQAGYSHRPSAVPGEDKRGDRPALAAPPGSSSPASALRQRRQKTTQLSPSHLRVPSTNKDTAALAVSKTGVQ